MLTKYADWGQFIIAVKPLLWRKPNEKLCVYSCRNRSAAAAGGLGLQVFGAKHKKVCARRFVQGLALHCGGREYLSPFLFLWYAAMGLVWRLTNSRRINCCGEGARGSRFTLFAFFISVVISGVSVFCFSQKNNVIAQKWGFYFVILYAIILLYRK